MILEYNVIEASLFDEITFFESLVNEYKRKNPKDLELKYIRQFMRNHIDCYFNNFDSPTIWENLTEESAEEIINKFYTYINHD